MQNRLVSICGASADRVDGCLLPPPQSGRGVGDSPSYGSAADSGSRPSAVASLLRRQRRRRLHPRRRLELDLRPLPKTQSETVSLFSTTFSFGFR